MGSLLIPYFIGSRQYTAIDFMQNVAGTDNFF